MNIGEFRILLASHHKRLVIVKIGNCIECISHYRNVDGYTVIGVKRKATCLHRQVYKWIHGIDLPSEILVRHSCDNPACINPEHLLIGTHQDNKNDAVERKRIAIGSKNGNAKLSENDVSEIMLSTLSQQKLADIYGVHKQTIGHIKRGISWSGSEN